MGITERLEFKLNLLLAHFAITAEASAGAEASVSVFGAVAGAVETHTPVASAGTIALPVTRLTVVEAIKQGLKLTGNEIDEQGCYWSEKINTKVPAVTQKNVWKKGKGIDDAVYDAEIARIKAELKSESPAVSGVPAGKTTSAAETTALVLGTPLPGVGAGLPLPGVAGGAGLPLPGVGGTTPAPADHPSRRKSIDLSNVLGEKYGISFDAMSALFSDQGSKTGGFADVPQAAYPTVEKLLNGWCIILDEIESTDQAILAMNGNDQSYLVQIMTQLKLGTTEVETVYYGQLYSLYEQVHGYLNVLEKHFGKPLTAIKPNPMV